ncbi:hypothetical protein IU501_27160 [Nocardia otitidiscaviarum]|uniref:hypothetical protein n=1 Tax=Nocardia otitidiscaviarum TaxID=1823 RepID=UPI0004A76E8F|nr:hypothetical protein [Nocardia otitidiscaviarum]MBF6136660.1 hypothetical protein [Nocardia otitidiscaviarum]MBF6484863.1 hypothetical protein [Nocardia otitidiscaviarum]
MLGRRGVLGLLDRRDGVRTVVAYGVVGTPAGRGAASGGTRFGGGIVPLRRGFGPRGVRLSTTVVRTGRWVPGQVVEW